jgi:hypothetical protein
VRDIIEGLLALALWIGLMVLGGLVIVEAIK